MCYMHSTVSTGNGAPSQTPQLGATARQTHMHNKATLRTANNTWALTRLLYLQYWRAAPTLKTLSLNQWTKLFFRSKFKLGTDTQSGVKHAQPFNSSMSTDMFIFKLSTTQHSKGVWSQFVTGFMETVPNHTLEVQKVDRPFHCVWELS